MEQTRAGPILQHFLKLGQNPYPSSELSAVALIYRLVEATPEVHPKWRRTKIFLCVSDCAVGLARVDGVLMDPRDPPTRTKKYCLILSNILRRFKLHSWCHVSNVKRPE